MRIDAAPGVPTRHRRDERVEAGGSPRSGADPPDRPPSLSFFDAGGTRLMLSVAEGEATGTSALYFFVSDIEGVTKELVRRGVRFVGEPHMIAKMPDHDLWLAEFRDSEENIMALLEEKRCTRLAD